jgi:hypothetical protein
LGSFTYGVMNLPGLHCSKHWACAEVDLYIKVATAARANKQHFIAKGCRNESGQRSSKVLCLPTSMSFHVMHLPSGNVVVHTSSN